MYFTGNQTVQGPKTLIHRLHWKCLLDLEPFGYH